MEYGHLKEDTGVYIITNHNTNKSYIGFTTQGVRTRVRRHINDLKANEHHSDSMQKDWNDDNSDWSANTVEITTDKQREVFWILKLRTHEIGYNYKIGDKFDEITKQKVSDNRAKCEAWNKGIPLTEEQKSNLRNCRLGSVISEEVKSKMSASHKGRVQSPIHVLRRNASMIRSSIEKLERTIIIKQEKLDSIKMQIQIMEENIND